MYNLTFLKLGGSVITDKSRPYTTRPQVIARLAREVAQYLGEKPAHTRVIIGNGAGSFAHRSAARYRTMGGYVRADSKYGAAFVHRDAERLNGIIIDALLKAGVKAISVPPIIIARRRNDRLEELLAEDYVPVVYGDVVLDQKRGCTIFSTEKVFWNCYENLSRKKFRVKKVIAVSDVDGVYDANKNLIAKIEISRGTSQGRRLFAGVGGSRGTDVTGGMAAKVKALAQFARAGVPGIIVSGLARGRVLNTLRGKKEIETLIV